MELMAAAVATLLETNSMVATPARTIQMPVLSHGLSLIMCVPAWIRLPMSDTPLADDGMIVRRSSPLPAPM